MSKVVWDESNIVEVSTESGIADQILQARGLGKRAKADFLKPKYQQILTNYQLLPDIVKAVARVTKAIKQGEKITIYGDYDIDGITASAVMIEALAAQGIAAMSYIPDRFEEGYGINEAALRTLKAAGIDLVISVDCGITSVNEAAWARSNGLDLIITDHHQPYADQK